MTAKSIMIAIPALDHKVNIYITAWIARLLQRNADATHPHKYQIMMLPGVWPVTYARNLIVQQFLRSPATHLFFLDADQVPLGDCERMFDREEDIVSGSTYLLTTKDDKYLLVGNGFAHTGDEPGHFNPSRARIPADLYQLDASGTGCLLISRRVFEDPAMLAAEPAEDPAKPLTFFQMVSYPWGEVRVGEDLDFTWRAKKLGYSVVLDSTAVFDHTKEVSLGAMLTYAEGQCASLSSTSKQPASQLPTDDSSVPASSSKTNEPSEPSEPGLYETNGQH